MLNPRWNAVVILVILTALPVTAATMDHESQIDAYFEEIHTDANAEGHGYLIGIPQPNTESANQLYWDVGGESITVDTWTRYYQSIAGVFMQDPDRQDDRERTEYGVAFGGLVSHEPSASLAAIPLDDQEPMIVSTSVSTNDFSARTGYIHSSESQLPGELAEVVDPDPPEDPRFFHVASQDPNFEYTGNGENEWYRIDGSFTISFIYGGFELSNETSSYHIAAQRNNIDGYPPLYEEYSITRAFIHVTNGTANIHPEGRTTQVNLASFDIPSSSSIRLANATGVWTQNGEEITFRNANVRIAGQDLGVSAEPYTQDGNLLKNGNVQGRIDEVTINGRPVELEPRSATINESPGFSPLLLFIAATSAALLALFYVPYRVVRRRQARRFVERASALFDEQYYEGAGYWALKAFKWEPHSKEAAEILAITALRSGDVNETIPILERTRGENDPLIRLLLAVSLQKADHPVQARRMMRALLDEHPYLYDIIAHTDLVVYDAAEDQGNDIY